MFCGALRLTSNHKSKHLERAWFDLFWIVLYVTMPLKGPYGAGF